MKDLRRTLPGLLVSLLLALGVGVSCSSSVEPPPTLLLHDWEGYMPEAVLAAFTQETGVGVELVTVVVIENRFIPNLVRNGLLVPLDHSKLPNFKNISLNFRNLMYDPGNRYTAPYSWGTTGLLVRPDLVEGPVKHWADLWDPRYSGKTSIWRGQMREVMGLVLKSLGYSEQLWQQFKQGLEPAQTGG